VPTEDTPTLISARSLTKIYTATRGQRVLALEAALFDISQGEFVSLVGPSGCGKSPLLRLIAGLQPATTGEVYVDGRKVEGPIIVGIVCQTPVLMPWMSVLANILLPIEILKLDKDDGRREAMELIELLGLSSSSTPIPSSSREGCNPGWPSAGPSSTGPSSS
jgi:NitT/TauT family transport system ATP-binding protein